MLYKGFVFAGGWLSIEAWLNHQISITLFSWSSDDCQCMLWQDFTGDVQDHSCTKGWVDNRSPKVKVVDGGVDGQGGRFR